MGFFILLQFFASLVAYFNVRMLLAPFSNSLQKVCENAVAISAHQDLQKALVCGVDLPQGSAWQNVLIHSGLIHLVVVSGSHFIVLNICIEFLCAKLRLAKIQKILTWIVLPAYALISGMQAPALRSLFAIALGEFSKVFRLGWSKLQILWASVIFAFSFCPQWSHSLSLILSATATLALIAQPKSDEFQKQSLIFILLLPALAQLQTFHPVHIFTNLIFAPMLSLLLLPLAAMAMLLPVLQPVFIVFAEFIFQILEKIIPLSPPAIQSAGLFNTEILWLTWLIFWIILYHQHVRHQRQNWSFL
jgi:ComEC/Rec2-related protein